MTVLRVGRALPGLGVGSCVVRLSRLATQSLRIGHASHSGRVRTHTVAPRSMIACV